MGKWMTVAGAGQLKEGEGHVVAADGTEVALFRVEGRVYACSNVCPHHGGPLGDGSLDGKVVSCPWHGWEFNVTTGRMPVNPNVGIRTYPAQVVDGDVQIEV